MAFVSVLVTPELHLLDYFSWYEVGQVIAEVPNKPFIEDVLFRSSMPECKTVLEFVSALETALYFGVKSELITQIKEEIYWYIGENKQSFDAWFGVETSFYPRGSLGTGQIMSISPKIIENLHILWNYDDMLKKGFRYIGHDVSPQRQYANKKVDLEAAIEISGNPRLVQSLLYTTPKCDDPMHIYQLSCQTQCIPIMQMVADFFKFESDEILQCFEYWWNMKCRHPDFELTPEAMDWVINKVNNFDEILFEMFLFEDAYKTNRQTQQIQYVFASILPYLEKTKGLLVFDENFAIKMASLCEAYEFWFWLYQEGKFFYNKQRWRNEVKQFQKFEEFFKRSGLI